MPRRSFALAPLLLLTFLVTSATSTPTRASLTNRGTRLPDWKIVWEDESSEPSLSQVAQAIAHTIGGPRLNGLRVSSGTGPYAGDGRLMATVSPNGDGVRDQAVLHFRLLRAATVTMIVLACSKHPKVIWTKTTHLRAGKNRLVWAPPSRTLPRTYMLHLHVNAGGAEHEYGNESYRLEKLEPAPVVRVQGLDAGFGSRSYSPGADARLRVATDAPSYTIQFFHAGPETQVTEGYQMEGVPVSEPRRFDWSAHRDSPGTLVLRLGNWPNGIYYARLTSPDGRVGYAPFVMRPSQYGRHRVAYIIHTNTWEAYNHQDVDDDGWGDTWYAADSIHRVELARHYIRFGAPPQWRRYDLTPLRWLYRTGKEVDFLSDDDLEHFSRARTLARLYDLIVFPGHEEYVTTHVYNLVSAYRNLGGNLMFLSATNFLWRIDRHGSRIIRVAQWRQLGRPESRLIGVQYRGNDEGEHRGPYVLTPYGQESWEFGGVDQTLVLPWRWFGIEFDMRTSVSPRSIRVLAYVNPHMRDPGLRGEMTYYERGGAKVFAAGVLNFPGSTNFPPFRRVLENVWERLVKP